jgi:hypothetical protein
MRGWVVVGLMALTGCASGPRVIGLLAAADVALFACDATQTYAASDGGKWHNGLHEADPLQGPAPSTERIYVLMTLNAAVAIAIAVSPIPLWARAATLSIIGLRVAVGVHSNQRYVSGCGL